MVGVHVSIPLSTVNLTGHVFANGGHLCYSIFQPLNVVNLTVNRFSANALNVHEISQT